MAGRNEEPPLLSGSTPGLFDPSQRLRLLRTPSSSLFFASFDPLTARASSFPNISALQISPEVHSKRVNLETSNRSNGKRIVIETDPENGTCSWRFVPRARVEGEFGMDEGPWPRVVQLCGRLVRMTQDQWDLHKLDPEYDCLVRRPPDVPVIIRIMSSTNALRFDSTIDSEFPATPKTTPAPLDDNTPTPKAKREVSSTPSDSESPRKKKRVKAMFPAESDMMAVDEDIFYAPSTPAPKTTTQDTANGKKRRRVSDRMGETSTPGIDKAKPSGKCRESSVFADLSSNSWSGDRRATDTSNSASNFDVPPTPVKRVRTHSPGAIKREIEQKRLDRERKRKADMEARLKLRREGIDQAFWEDLGVPSAVRNPGMHTDLSETDDSDDSADDQSTVPPSDPVTELEDEAERLAKIEESRRKLAELEKDRPLWEETARKRKEREEEEEKMRQRAKAMREEEVRQQERIRVARRQREEKREQERHEQEHKALIKERSRRMFVSVPRGVYRWSYRLALERFLQTAVDFDAAKFSATMPLAFASVPWPMLHTSFSVQDVDWDAVEAFFRKMETLLTPVDFKELVEKSHRRFHPDRWRSRGLLVSVKDDVERDLLEVAGSTVAQAITPLWKEVTGR